MDFFVSRIMQQTADPGFSAEEYFDYGPGLYGEIDLENARGVLKEASIDTDGLQMEMYEALDERWLRFVIGNRTGYAEQDVADLILAPHITDTMYAVIGAVQAGKVDEKKAVKMLSEIPVPKPVLVIRPSAQERVLEKPGGSKELFVWGPLQQGSPFAEQTEEMVVKLISENYGWSTAKAREEYKKSAARKRLMESEKLWHLSPVILYEIFDREWLQDSIVEVNPPM